MKLRTPNRLGIVSSALVACACLAACGGPDGSLEADDATAAEIDEQEAVQRHAERGPLGLVELALREDIALSEAQRATLESLRETGKPEHHGPPREHAAALAAAVRAGSIDVAALTPERSPRDDMHQQIGAALDTLHDTLSGTQRRKLVKLARERVADGPSERRGPPPALLPGPGRGAPLIPGVELGDAQREKIEAALAAKGIAIPVPPDESEMKARRAEMDAAREKLLDGFVADDFEPSKALPAPRMMKLNLVEVLAVALPLLSDAQREAVAVAIEEGPPGPPGHRGPPVEEER